MHQLFTLTTSRIKQWSTPFLLGVFCLLFLGFGLSHLGKFMTADEDLWFANPYTGRVQQYWHALSTHQWKATRINDKPGVTTALVSGGMGMFFDTHPEQKITERITSYIKVYNPSMSERTAFFYRLPILLLNAALILLMFFLLRRFTEDTALSLLATGFMYTSPILVGISQIVNPDATLWSFGFAALLAYLVFLKTTNWRFLWLAGILEGLALLSKYSATYIILFACFSTFVYLLFQNSEWLHEPKALTQYAKKIILGFPIFVAIALITFSFGMPAVFTDPTALYQATLGFRMAKDVTWVLLPLVLAYSLLLSDVFLLEAKLTARLLGWCKKLPIFLTPLMGWIVGGLLLFAFANWFLHNQFSIPNVAFDLGRFKNFYVLTLWQKLVLEVRMLPFTVPLSILVTAGAALFFSSIRSRFRFLVFTMASFIFLFWVAVLLQDVLLSVRYGIFLYPAIGLLAAIGTIDIFGWLKRHQAFRIGFLFIVITSSITSLALSRPFYFNYTNFFLPQEFSVTGAWGYGGYEAAQTLNALPNAKNMVAWSDYDGFCVFFVGKCMEGSSIAKWAKHQDKNLVGIDYFIATKRGSKLNASSWNKITKSGILDPTPVWELRIGGRERNYVQIYRAHTPSTGVE